MLKPLKADGLENLIKLKSPHEPRMNNGTGLHKWRHHVRRESSVETLSKGTTPISNISSMSLNL
jgi:hypothetical protein